MKAYDTVSIPVPHNWLLLEFRAFGLIQIIKMDNLFLDDRMQRVVTNDSLSV